MNFQDASNLQIPEGYVRTIHDKNSRLLWGSVGYDVSFDGNATQTTYTGKNLVPFTNQDYTLSGVRVYVQDGELYLNGTATANVSSNASYWKTSFAFTLPAGTYTFGASEYTFVQGEQFFMHKADQTDLGYIKNTTAKTVTFTLEEETSVYLGIFWANGSVFNNKKISITLNSGSTAQPYERFVGGIPAPNPSYPQPISVVTGENVVKVVGKNLANLENGGFAVGTITQNNATITHDANSLSIEATGTVGAQFVFWDTAVSDASATYTFSGKAVKNVAGSSSTPFLRVPYLYSDDGTNWSTAVIAWTEQNPVQGQVYDFSFNVSGHKYYRFRFYNDGGNPVTVGEKSTYYDIQLELGNQATSYQAFTEQSFTIDLGSTELAKIGTYQDRIYKEDSKWYVEKNVGKVVLDGSETYNGGGTFSNAPNYCVITSKAYDSVLGAVVPAVADYFVNYSASTIYQGMPAFDEARFSVGSGSNQKLRFAMPVSLLDVTTTTTQASSFTDWVTAHNITIYYALATPTTTEITDATLIAQLEAVYDWVRRHGYSAQVSGVLPIVINRTALPTA